MIPTVLQTIAKSVEARLVARKQKRSFSELQALASTSRFPLPFENAFLSSGTHIISEIKFRSPALGILEKAGLDEAVEIAKMYVNSGATAISVLTEMDHFHGSSTYLTAIRLAFPNALLLMKDFVLEEYQLLEARVMGADAALLIVSLLGEARTKELLTFARSIGLGVLVEVHDEAELKSAFAIGSTLVGVNNRDLKTLEISIDTSVRLAPQIPKGSTVMSESCISSRLESLKLEALGYRGFLVGGSLMTSGNPGLELKKLMGTLP
jgi:indole-3-glycerol phosphate synthase